jgi:threonine/homoserine/homoserine lactone efflux protein
MDLTASWPMILGVSAETLAAFTAMSILIEITPGPNMTWLAVVAATEGRRTGYAAVLGVMLGLAAIGLAASVGLAGAIAASPVLYQGLRWAGVCYLLWLAWDAWRDAADFDGTVIGPDDTLRYFRRGFVSNVLNPKAALFYVSVLPAFVVAARPIIAQTMVLTLVYVAVATVIHVGIVTLAGTARRFLDQPRRARVLRRALSLALVGIAVWVAWATRAGG